MMEKVLPFEKAVIAERCAQEGKWGRQRHVLSIWLTILSEEIGEVSRAILDACAADQMVPSLALFDVRGELIQAAAVCRAMMEQIDEVLEPPEGQATAWPPKEESR